MIIRMNQKRFALCLILCLILTIFLSGSAMAANLELFATAREEQYGGVFIQSAVPVGDSIWFLSSDAYDGYAVSVWNKGDEDAHQVGRIPSSLYYSTKEEMDTYSQGLDTEHAGSFLVADGDRVLSLNLLTGRLFAMKESDGALVFEDVPAGNETGLFDMTGIYPPESGYFEQIRLARSQGDSIQFMFMVWDEISDSQVQRCFTLNLKDGSVTKTDMNVVQICEGPDGELYGIWRDEMNAYDPETDTMTNYTLMRVSAGTGETAEICEIPEATISGLSYSSSLDRFIYLKGSRIMALSLEGEVSQVGFTPIEMYDPVMFESDGQMLIAGYAGVYLRDISLDFSADRSVTLYSIYNQDATRLFNQQEPNVPVYESNAYYEGADKILEGMKNGDMDVLAMTINYQPYAVLRDHGYCLPLDSDDAPKELKAFYERLHPIYAQEMTYKDHVVALPTGAYSYDGILYYPKNIEEAGFSMDEMPDNLLDLIRFISEWNDDYAEDHPDFTPVRFWGDIKNTLTSEIIQRYINYCKAQGEIISFSTPLFRELMDAVAQLHTENLPVAPSGDEEEFDEEVWDAYYQVKPLLELNYSLVGSFNQMYSEEETVIKPIALKAGQEPMTFVNLSVIFVNPYSKHLNEAMEYVSCAVQSILGNTTEYVLCADMEEPLLNPNFDDIVRNYTETISSYEKLIENAQDDEERSMYQESYDYLKNALENMDRFRYLVTEDQLQIYREDLMPLVHVAQRTFLNSSENDTVSELNSLIARLESGQMTLDQFIHDADGKLRMMQLEDE